VPAADVVGTMSIAKNANPPIAVSGRAPGDRDWCADFSHREGIWLGSIYALLDSPGDLGNTPERAGPLQRASALFQRPLPEF
jgi:hypothetical protein